MHVGWEMWQEITDRALAREVFAKTVSRIEMETHSYCNRRCSYCPNVVGDRLGANQFMPPAVWERIVSGLEEIDYKSNLILNYYNEPLADRDIFNRIREARTRIPNCKIMIYTNGDYLEPGIVDELSEAGLDYMHISIHLKRDDKYTDIYVINRMNEIGVRMGIPIKIKRLKSMEFAFGTAAHRKMEIDVRGINFHKHGTDRGGLISDITTEANRTTSCHFPFSHFVVSYAGSVVPCCHIRADRAEHEDYVYGNILDYETIFQAFTSAPAAAWRRELGSDRAKRSPCDTCSAGALSPDNEKIMVTSRNHYVAAQSSTPAQAS